jgi:ankyrin repeat protein
MIAVNAADADGRTPLMLATRAQRSQKGWLCVDKLLQLSQTNVNIADRQGRTSLHFACLRGRVQIVLALLEADCDVNAADRNGQTPLYIAHFKKRRKIARLLCRHPGIDLSRAGNVDERSLAMYLSHAHLPW